MERTEERIGFCGGGCDGFVGHVSPGCQGAPVWWYGGVEGGQDLLLLQRKRRRRRMGQKQGLSLIHPSLPLSLSHTDTNSLKSLLPEVLLTVASHPKGS